MSTTPFREIGRGACGSVWVVDRDGSACALKREDASTSRSIHNDSVMHQKVQKSIEKLKGRHPERFVHTNIPTYITLVEGTNTHWWESRLPRFPEGLQPCNVLISERILPFDREVRERLIDLYCPEHLRGTIKANRSDADCIVRPYLGRNHRGFQREATDQRPRLQYFKLRNKPLHLNKVRDIGCPVESYARAMADALAILYWDAKVDANDVEFVLAPKGSHLESDTWQNETLAEHTMWILDFDLVRGVTMDAEGVERCVEAFWRNDSYYPRPEGDRELWRVFEERFLESSELVLGDSELPRLLIRRIEEEGVVRKERIRLLSD